MSRWVTVLWVLTAVVVTSHPALAESRHSGIVRAMEGNAIVIEEMGPWTSPNTRPVEKQIMVTPATRMEVAQRQDETTPAVDSASWPGGFAERPAEARAVRPGDFVTVIADAHEGRMVATKIILLQPDASGSASPATSPALPPERR
jgi:hypothetical protein